MNLTFTPSAWEDYQWFLQHDRKLVKRINQLIQDVLRTPLEGIGKPEALKAILPATGRAASTTNIDWSTPSKPRTCSSLPADITTAIDMVHKNLAMKLSRSWTIRDNTTTYYRLTRDNTRESPMSNLELPDDRFSAAPVQPAAARPTIPPSAYQYAVDTLEQQYSERVVRQRLREAGYEPDQVEHILAVAKSAPTSDSWPEDDSSSRGIARDEGIPDEAYTFALEGLLKGHLPSEIRRQLHDTGYTPEQAENILAYAIDYRNEHDLRSVKQNPDGHGGGANMAIGGAICLAGLLITVGSMMASSGGGTVVIAWGAIIYGGIRFFRGLAQNGGSTHS